MSMAEMPDGWPDPAGLAKLAALQHRAREIDAAGRQAMLDWAWLFCGCEIFPLRPGGPAQRSCPVHGTFLVLPDGRLL